VCPRENMSKSKALSLAQIILVSISVALLASCAAPSPEPPVVEATPRQGSPAVFSTSTNSSTTTQVAAAPDILKEASARTPEPFEDADWQHLFDGKSLKGWRETQFAGRGEVQCRDGLVVLNMGDPFTGINWTNDFPTMNYEVALDAMRVMGSD